MSRFIAFAGIFWFTIGCGGRDTKGGYGASASGAFTNSAILTGAPIGLDLDLPSKLSRVIPADISGLEMTGSQAYLGRFTATSDSYYLIVPVINQGTRLRCFVHADVFELLDADGASLNTPISSYIYGSVGRSVIYTNTCIEPGGTGYMLDTAADSFARLASVRLVFSSEDREYLPPETSIVPLSYSVVDRSESYAITVANQGPMTATVEEAWVIYFVDDSDILVAWDSIVATNSKGGVWFDLTPGATGQVTWSPEMPQWTGNSTKQLVLIEFDVNKYAQTPTLASDADTAAAAEVKRSRQALADRVQALRSQLP